MKKLQLFYLTSCPYCIEVLGWIDRLKIENPVYEVLEIEYIEEALQPHVAELYDYYRVPCFYIDGVKVHEGVATPKIVSDIFEKAAGSSGL